MGLGLLFAESDKIFICNVDSTGTYNEFVGTTKEVAAELNRKPRNFFCINPVKGQRRLKKEVKRYTNFLIESDTTELEKQFELLPKLADLGIIRTATFSGGKSIHFVISCTDDLSLGEPGSEQAEQAYKQIWQGLANIFGQAGLDVADHSNKNPVTLSRLPGQFRGETKQKLLNTGNLVTAEFLQSIAIRNVKQTYVQATERAASVKDLEARLNSPEHGRLAMQIKYPAWVSANAGNYPNLLRLSLWCIDEVGATPDTLLPYFEKYLVPHLHARNYHKDWQLPVIHAFRMKGLL